MPQSFTFLGDGPGLCNPDSMGDLEGNGIVEFADFLVLSGNFGQSSDPPDHKTGDIDCSGTVDFADSLTLSANFGQNVGGAAAVPETSALALFGVACLLIGLTRRGRK